MSDIIIRDLTTHEEYAAAEAIQRVTWGIKQQLAGFAQCFDQLRSVPLTY